MIIVINRKYQHYCLFCREFYPQSSTYQRYIFCALGRPTCNFNSVSVLVIKSRGCNDHYILIVLLICTGPMTAKQIQICNIETAITRVISGVCSDQLKR